MHDGDEAHERQVVRDEHNVDEAPVPYHGLRLGLRDAAGDTVEALVAGLALPLGPADRGGYRWVDLPPLLYLEALVSATGATPAR